MKVNYRIGNLELRLQDPNENVKVHSPWSEIVKWEKRNTDPTSDNDEYCYTIATYDYDSYRDGLPELRFCGNRPCDLSSEEMEIFMDLVKAGYKYRREDDLKLTKIR
jgi:hypothetical protein